MKCVLFSLRNRMLTKNIIWQIVTMMQWVALGDKQKWSTQLTQKIKVHNSFGGVAINKEWTLIFKLVSDLQNKPNARNVSTIISPNRSWGKPKTSQK